MDGIFSCPAVVAVLLHRGPPAWFRLGALEPQLCDFTVASITDFFDGLLAVYGPGPRTSAGLLDQLQDKLWSLQSPAAGRLRRHDRRPGRSAGPRYHLCANPGFRDFAGISLALKFQWPGHPGSPSGTTTLQQWWRSASWLAGPAGEGTALHNRNRIGLALELPQLVTMVHWLDIVPRRLRHMFGIDERTELSISPGVARAHRLTARKR